MKKKVILTRYYQKEAVEELKKTFRLVVVEGSGKDLTRILEENRDAEALIPFLSDTVDRPIIRLLPRLKIIANYAVGYNNIDFEYALERGIYVTHTPDVLTDATADLTVALILAVARRVVEGDRYLRGGHFKGWNANLLLGKELKDSTLGIVGLGRIGLATALRARGFGMKVIYHSRTRKRELERKYGFRFVSFGELIGTADIVSPHIPYGPGVHHLFDKGVFDRMKKDAVFINVSRGPLMDEEYLAEKLEKGELFGAGLDVYEFEPRVTEKLKKLKNVVLLPHLGSATTTARLGMAQITVDSVKQALSGRRPDHLIPQWP